MVISLETNARIPMTISHKGEMSTFVQILRYRAHHQPRQLAYTFLQADAEVATLTYGELDRKVSAIAATLQMKAPQGSRILLAYQPGLDFAAAFLACLYAGMIAVPAYAPRRNQKTSRLRSIVASANILLALTTSHLETSIEQFCQSDSVLSGLQWIFTDQIFPDTLQGIVKDKTTLDIQQRWKEPELTLETLAFLQYTSGSTGDPKGVMVSHGNLLHNSSVIASCFAHTAESRGLIWLPPYHDMGLIGGILQPLYAGFPVYLMSPVDFLQKPLRWLHAISHYGATTSGGPNFAYELAVRKATPEKLAGLDLSRWQVAFTGAEPVRAQTIDKFTEVFAPYGFRREAFYPCYGMAETTLIVSGGEAMSMPIVKNISSSALVEGRAESVPENRSDRSAVVSCGLPRQTVRIVNDQSGLLCKENQVGEIWVASESVAQGYWDQPEKTINCFKAYLKSTDDSDRSEGSFLGPFLRTGDLGFLDGDQLYVTGRVKDLIIIRGQNHYPQDIELTAEHSHPSLRTGAGAAFSIELKQSEQLVIAFEVERSYLRELKKQQQAEAVFKNIRQSITASHSLETYAIALVKTGSIPKTSSGKIRRQACKQAFLTGGLTIVADWSRDPRRTTSFQSLQFQIDNIFQQVSKETAQPADQRQE